MDWSALLLRYLPIISRLVIIVFAALGTVYMMGRLLLPKLKDRSKNLIAFFALIIVSFAVTLIYDYNTLIDDQQDKMLALKFLLDAGLYTAGAAVLYVVFGWRLYGRMDSFLDKKFGKDKAPRKPRKTKKK